MFSISQRSCKDDLISTFIRSPKFIEDSPVYDFFRDGQANFLIDDSTWKLLMSYTLLSQILWVGLFRGLLLILYQASDNISKNEMGE